MISTSSIEASSVSFFSIESSIALSVTERAAMCGIGCMPSSRNRAATKAVSAGSDPGRKVTFTSVPGARTSAKLSTLPAPAGVTSIDQPAPALAISSIVTAMNNPFYVSPLMRTQLANTLELMRYLRIGIRF